MIWKIVLFSFTIWYVYFRWTGRKLYRMASQFKCDIKTLPIIGHAYLGIGDSVVHMNALKLFSKEAIKQGGLTNMWLGSKYLLVVADAEISQIIMKNCLEKDDLMRFVKDFTGNAGVYAPVSIWRPRRKILASAFSPKNLKCFVKTFSQHSSVMINQLLKNAPTGNFSIWSYFTTYTMDSICQSAGDFCFNAQLNHDEPLLKAYEEGIKIITNRFCKPWLHPQLVFKALPDYKIITGCKELFHGMLDKVLISKQDRALKGKGAVKGQSRQTKLGKKTKPKTFMDLITEASGGVNGYSDIELKEEVLVLVVAGTDTSAIGTSYTTLMLSRHQDVQKKVYQELLEVFGDSDRPIVAEDLPRLKYLDAVIKESLRLHPPGPVLLRKIEKDITLPSGVTLVAGSGVLISIWGVHRNPRYWGTDAEEFRPERFLESSSKHSSAFMAFSYGPRNCIGYQFAMMSMKTVIASLLRQYKVLPSVSESDPYGTDCQNIKHKPLRESFNLMLKDADNFTLRVQRRK